MILLGANSIFRMTGVSKANSVKSIPPALAVSEDVYDSAEP
jgi:hypothetical protein